MELQYEAIIRENLIPNAIKYVVFDAIDEVIIEQYFDEIVTRLATELANPLATHVYEVIVAEQEERVLEQSIDNYQQRVLADILIENILYFMDNRK